MIVYQFININIRKNIHSQHPMSIAINIQYDFQSIEKLSINIDIPWTSIINIQFMIF